jgi:hypothetical protein
LKTPHLPTFDGKSDPSEHLMAVGTQTVIIGASDHLKCKLLSGTLKEACDKINSRMYKYRFKKYRGYIWWLDPLPSSYLA